MANIEIRRKIGMSLIPKWKIAEVIGINEATFSRWMRYEMSEERKQRVLMAIEKLSKRQAVSNE